MANNVQMQDTISFVYFVVINSMLLKRAIIEHCFEWQNKLTALLRRMTKTIMDNIYKYIQDNSLRSV